MRIYIEQLTQKGTRSTFTFQDEEPKVQQSGSSEKR